MDLSGTFCPYCGTALDAEYVVGIYCDHLFERDVLSHMACAEQRGLHNHMELKVRVLHKRGADRFKYRPYSFVHN